MNGGYNGTPHSSACWACSPGIRPDDLTRFSQVRLPRWHTRRIVLVGDAAHCTDPLAGLGAHAALLGASTLAQSLPAAGEDMTAAFAAYEARIRPFVQLSQRVTGQVPGQGQSPGCQDKLVAVRPRCRAVRASTLLSEISALFGL
ncbi:FAD-dependent monooxygenase [Streptomyces sp. NPDC058694]|uniref:FAD-dependent monooxygenase n=1 Tax=Streptomyces sp. NPDC058694 TaxID=3346603 RepID=UPI003663048B